MPTENLERDVWCLPNRGKLNSLVGGLGADEEANLTEVGNLAFFDPPEPSYAQ